MLGTVDQAVGVLKAGTTTRRALFLKHHNPIAKAPPVLSIDILEILVDIDICLQVFHPAQFSHFASLLGCLQVPEKKHLQLLAINKSRL